MSNSNYKIFFDEYKNSINQIESDLIFWKRFLQLSIEKYKFDNPINGTIFTSGFLVYNYSVKESDTWANISNETVTIEIENLNEKANDFFIWAMNLSIVRIYNLLERLLLQAIQNRFYPSLESPINGKKEANIINMEIKKFLKENGHKVETKNNNHLITFLKKNVPEFNLFLSRTVNDSLSTTWENYFEFISILRNVISHDGMLIVPNTRNHINKIARDVFERDFTQPLNNKIPEILKPIDSQKFSQFMNNINTFVANTIKFIADENDFAFIGLYGINNRL